MCHLLSALIAAAVFSVGTLTAGAAEKNDQTKAEYNAAKARADADYNVSRVHCKNLAGNDRDVCEEKAKANLTKANADAKAKYEGTGEAKLDARKEEIEADYEVAKEKCDSLAGDAKDVCVAEAKAAYAKEKASLEAREKSMEADYKVAKERCNTLSGDTRRACLKEARVRFDD